MLNLKRIKKKIKTMKLKKILPMIIRCFKESAMSIISFIVAIAMSYQVISMDIKNKPVPKKEKNNKDTIEQLDKKIEEIEKKKEQEYINTDASLYESVGEKFYLKYYDSFNGGPDTGSYAGFVKEAKKGNNKLLIDATNYEKVLLDNFDEINETYYYKYYDSYYGGKDIGNIKSNGYVTEIIIDGIKYLVDANNFNNILLSDYESISEPFYIKSYDEYYGGKDNNNSKSNGYVVEIIKQGKKYLTDANNFNNIIVSDYIKLIEKDENTIMVEYANGEIKDIISKTRKEDKTLILKNK